MKIKLKNILEGKYYSYDDFLQDASNLLKKYERRGKQLPATINDTLEKITDAQTKNAFYSVRNGLSYLLGDKFIKKQTDKSSNKGIKFQFDLVNGDVIHAFKVGRMMGDWELYFNNKKTSIQNIYKHYKEQLSAFEKYEKEINSHDFLYNYADDHRSWKSGVASVKSLENLYSTLSNEDKKKAYKLYLKAKNDNIKAVSFSKFKGA